MDQSLLIFESSPLYLFLCAILALGISWYFYKTGRNTWGNKVNYTLFGLRSFLIFLLAALLLSPVLKYIQNQIEDPLVILAVDNSVSLKEVTDSVALQTILTETNQLLEDVNDNGYRTRVITLDGLADNPNEIQFSNNSSDLTGLLKQVENRYEGQNLHSVILLSDGIYNSGSSPIYSNYNYDLYTIGIGDSLPRQDISIQNVRYNRVSYQGNKFPVQVSILNEGFTGSQTQVVLRMGNRIVDSRQVEFDSNRKLTVIDYLLDAETEGTQRLTIQVDPLDSEFTTANNYKTFFVDVVEGKENILLLSERPHPDIKALREAIESNPNYSFTSYIRGISKNAPEEKVFDLVICHQCTGQEGFIQTLGLNLEETPMWTLFGKQMSISALNRTGLVIFESILNEYDAVTPAFNPGFTGFEYSDELQQLMREFPPVAVPFGDIANEFETESLLFQRVGSIETPKPLLVIKNSEPRSALLLGEGLWRWKLHDYLRNDNNQLFTELVSKIVQFLSTRENKEKLRVYPIKDEFQERTVTLETEIYNELYERIYDIPVILTVTNEAGESTEYTYAISSSNSRYQINGLSSGIYKYRASATIGDQRETASGQFIVNEQQLEYLNLTADFRLLRNLANDNNGQFYFPSEISALEDELSPENAKGVIHSSEAYDPLINLPWLLAVLLAFVTAEWFIRKFFGVY